VVEVATYKGGLTAQLALICARLGWPCWSLDVDSSFAAMAADLVQRVGLAETVSFHFGPLESFTPMVKMAQRPVLVILDGDHRYDAVMQISVASIGSRCCPCRCLSRLQPAPSDQRRKS
jgi:predicted O-methyltransferase YrrM